MTIEHLPHSTDAPPIITFEAPECLTVASCKRKLALIQNHALLSKEFDHRLMNELQVIVACFRCKAANRRIPRSLLTWLPRPTA